MNTLDLENVRLLSGRRLTSWIGTVLLFIIVFFPIWWVIRTATTDFQKTFTDTASLLPVDPTLENFERALGLVDVETSIAGGGSGQRVNFSLFLKNTTIIAVAITVGQVFFSSLAGYSFARLRFPFRDQIFYLYLTGLMVPAIVLLIPNFVLIRELEWVGTYQGIVAPTFLMTPFAVFFMRQFFLTLSEELFESARLDGAGQFSMFWRIALPLSMPALTTLAILVFLTSWNDYLWPLIVGRNEEVRTLTVALGIFRQQTPQGSPDWTGLMAGTTLALIPPLLIFTVFGRRVVDSIQFSGFK